MSSALVIFGEAWLNEHDYFSLSEGFRAKMRKLMKGFSTGETTLSRPAIALSQNRFAPAQISTLLQDKLGVALKLKTTLADIDRRRAPLDEAVRGGGRLQPQAAPEPGAPVAAEGARLHAGALPLVALREPGSRSFKKLKTFRLNHGWLFEIGIFPGGGHVLLVEGRKARSSR